MIRRCTYPSMQRYPRYGGRGITICSRWLGENGFINFFNDVGTAPSPEYTLDRINTDGNYEPSNVRWATRSQQIRNSSKARYITFNGETHTIGDWEVLTGIKRRTIQARLDKLKWPIEKSLTLIP